MTPFVSQLYFTTDCNRVTWFCLCHCCILPQTATEWHDSICVTAVFYHNLLQSDMILFVSLLYPTIDCYRVTWFHLCHCCILPQTATEWQDSICATAVFYHRLLWSDMNLLVSQLYSTAAMDHLLIVFMEAVLEYGAFYFSATNFCFI